MIGAVRELLEHYLGDANMAHNVFLRELLAANGGVAPIDTLLTFPRLAAMLAEHGGPESARAAVVAVAVRDSALLLLSDDGSAVGRRTPVPPEAAAPRLTPTLDEYLSHTDGGRSALRWSAATADSAGGAGSSDAAFMQWAERVAINECESSGAFRSRCAVRDARCRPAVERALEEFRSAMEALEAHPLFETLREERMATLGLRKKVAGLLKSAKPGLEEKRVAATAELSEAEERVTGLIAAMGETWVVFSDAETRLGQAEQLHSKEAAAAAKGKRSSDLSKRKAGKALEAAGLSADFLRHVCSCTHGLPAHPNRPPDHLLIDPGPQVDDEGQGGTAGVRVLSNVTLQAGEFELDHLVIVPDRGDDNNSIQAQPEPEPEPDSACGESESRVDEDKLTRQGSIASSSSSSSSEKVVVVEALVVGIVEAKSNPNDIGVSFAHFQRTIAWLSGATADYDPADYRTKAHPTGHFVRGEHRQGGVRYVFTPNSFRLLQRRTVHRRQRWQGEPPSYQLQPEPETEGQEEEQVYVDRVHYITASKPLVDVDSKHLQRIVIPKAGTSPALSLSSSSCVSSSSSSSATHSEPQLEAEPGDTGSGGGTSDGGGVSVECKPGLRLCVVGEHFRLAHHQQRARQALDVVNALGALPVASRDAVVGELDGVGIGATLGMDTVDGFWWPRDADDAPLQLQPAATGICSPGPAAAAAAAGFQFGWRWVRRGYASARLLVGEPADRIRAHTQRMNAIKHCLKTEKTLVTVLLGDCAQGPQQQPQEEQQQQSSSSLAERAASRFVSDWREKLNEAQAEREWLTSEVLSLYVHCF